ncbi:MAG: CvpA family protein [Lachnospiraceae bacterium]
MNWLTIAVIVFLIGMSIYGYKKGLLRIALSLTATIITIVLTIFLNPYVEDFMREETRISNSIQKGISSYLEEDITDKIDSLSPKEEITIIDKIPLPKAISNELKENNNLESYQKIGVNNFWDYLSTYLTDIVVRALAFVITFILAFIVLRLLFFVLNIVSHLPVIHGANKVAGAMLGFVEGLLLLWVLCLIATACGSTEIGSQMLEMIQSSVFLSFLYNNNLLIKILLGSIMTIF